MSLHAVGRVVGYTVAFGLSVSLLAGHYNPGQEAETTDDPRLVLIPPRDRSQDPILVLRGGTLIDGTGSPPLPNAVLVIQGDRILEVGSADDVAIPGQVKQVIDVTGSYIVPGLIDLHIHFTQWWKEDFSSFTDSDASAAIRGVKKLGVLLDGGITTVRDLGTRNDVAFKIKEAVERRIFDGPRVYWSGQGIMARGGHGDEMVAVASGRPDASAGASELAGGPSARVANGPWDWRLAVREQIRQHADLIKLFAPYTREEIEAAVDEAHLQGFRVTVDTFGKYTTWAVEAGVDCVEHPLAMPDEAIALMAAKGTQLVPTLTAYYNVLTTGYPSGGLLPGGFYYDQHRSFDMTHEGNLETVRKARQAGVMAGIGSDIPFEGEKYYPGAYFSEIQFFKDAGFTNQEVLESATRVGAEILGMDAKLGTLEEGKLADVLVVAEDPLDDIQNLQKMRLVIADGRVVRNRME